MSSLIKEIQIWIWIKLNICMAFYVKTEVVWVLEMSFGLISCEIISFCNGIQTYKPLYCNHIKDANEICYICTKKNWLSVLTPPLPTNLWWVYYLRHIWVGATHWWWWDEPPTTGEAMWGCFDRANRAIEVHSPILSFMHSFTFLSLSG